MDLWFYFEGEDTRSKTIETMWEYNEFFRFTPHAYFASYVVHMAGVSDKRPGTISIVSPLLTQATEPIRLVADVLKRNLVARRPYHKNKNPPL